MKVHVSVDGLMHSASYGLPETLKAVEVECDFLPESDDVDNVLIPELAGWQEDGLVGDEEFFGRLVDAAREAHGH